MPHLLARLALEVVIHQGLTTLQVSVWQTQHLVDEAPLGFGKLAIGSWKPAQQAVDVFRLNVEQFGQALASPWTRFRLTDGPRPGTIRPDPHQRGEA